MRELQHPRAPWRRGATAALVVLLGALGAPARADNVGFSQTIALDPSALTVPPVGMSHYTQTFTGMPTLMLQAGDHLMGEIDFSNGALAVAGAMLSLGIAFTHDPQSDASVNTTSTVTLLDLAGILTAAQPYTISSQSPNAVLRAVIGPTGAGQNFSFSGITYDIVVNTLTPSTLPAPASLDFSLSSLTITATSVAVVPEPPGAALIAAGLCAIGLRRWRRHPDSA